MNESPKPSSVTMNVIEQLRIRDNAKLRELTRMHLTFMLDLNDEHFEQLMVNDDFEHQKMSKNDAAINALIVSKSRKDNHLRSDCTIFGASLTHEGICVMYQLIQFIGKDQNITQKGIFRISGSVSRQLELRNWLNCGTTIDLDDNRFTVNDCATVLKAFLSELPEPLLTEAHFKAHCQIVEKSNSQPVMSPNMKQNAIAKRLKTVQLLLLLLPEVNRKFLQDLLELLHDVALHSETNKMTAHNIAILFAPHLLCPKRFTAIDLHRNLNIIADALKFMIDHTPAIFDAPNELVRDADEYLKKLSNGINTSSIENGVKTVVAFQYNSQPIEEDYTQMQLAKLYAHVQSMPETPQKKKMIKQFNRENGHGTPLNLKQSTDSSKKTLKTIGGVMLKAGQNLFRGGVLRNSGNNIKKNREKLSASAELDTPNKKKHIFKRSASVDDELMYGDKTPDTSRESEDTDTPLGLSIENANKRVKTNIRIPGNRDPLIM